MRFRLGCELGYSVEGPATFVFNVAPAAGDRNSRIVEEFYSCEPRAEVERLDAPDGSRLARLSVGSGNWSFAYAATIERRAPREETSAALIEIPPARLPVEVLPFLAPSRYCESDRLALFAAREFGGVDPGLTRVTAVCNWIYDHIKYLRGSTDQHTSACDTLIERAGVCRDFAHLGIALCRALNIPARFLSAYAYQLTPPDFHACFEAYLGDAWYVFDPTRLAPNTGFVRIAVGRDASDAPFASIFGAAELKDMRVTIEAESNEPPDELPVFTTAAVGISAD